MCINVGNNQSQINALEKTNKNELKSLDNNDSKSDNSLKEDEKASTLEENYSLNVDKQYKDSGHAATTISFDNPEPIKNAISNKLDAQEMKIVEFISSMKDKTLQCVLDAFQRSIEETIKRNKENMEFFLKVTKPKQEALKDAVLKEQMLKEDRLKA